MMFTAMFFPAIDRSLGLIRKTVCVSLSCIGWVVVSSCGQPHRPALSPQEALGKEIFFDESLSEPAGQSCATCHTAEKGYADRYARITSEGAVKERFSNRNSMTSAYAAYVPALYYDEEEATYVGGLFWDGRVNTLEEQALQPFVNPLEMGNRDLAAVASKIRQAPYYPELVRLYGETTSADTLMLSVAGALAAYERSEEMNPFTSKYDAWQAGRCQLSPVEQKGWQLFKEKALCAECHVLDNDDRAGQVLFTDHTYDNLGIPSNPENPFFRVGSPYNLRGRDTLDLGLGAFLGDTAEYGKFRVPTLRNIALTAPYGHNGYFKTLEEIVHFYNVRDVEVFPPAEYAPTVNQEELGRLGLTAEEEAALVAFLYTLTDGYRPE